MQCSTKIFAHRGHSFLYPENTMRAFKEAALCGADGIELDVQLSADGEVVIYHDYSLKANTSRFENVNELTADELAHTEVHAGELQIPGSTIPTLREYFEFMKDKDIITDIELKNTLLPEFGLEEKVLGLIDEYHMQKKVLFSSFNHSSLRKLKALAPDIGCGCLFTAFLDNAGKYAHDRDFSWINPTDAYITEDVLENLTEFGVGCMVWTVNDEERMEWLFKHDVFAIITDKPELAYAVRNGLE